MRSILTLILFIKTGPIPIAFADPPVDSSLHLTNFRVGYLHARSEVGSNSSGFARWAPYYNFSDGCYVVGKLGGTVLTDDEKEAFSAIDAQALLGYRPISQFSIELGGGLQRWSKGEKKNQPLLTGMIVYSPFETPMFGIDALLLGISSAQGDSKTTEIQAGLQLGI